MNAELLHEFERRPREPELSLWQGWLRRHGVDPYNVLVDFIERRPERRQLVYRGVRCCPSGASRAGDPLTHVHVEQLEGVPLPFPVVAG